MAQQRHPTATYVHIESGKRICQLYAELGQVDPLTSAGTLAGWMALERQNPGYAGASPIGSYRFVVQGSDSADGEYDLPWSGEPPR